MSAERRTQIIGIRIPTTIKKRILEEAKKREETMTAFLYELIVAGWKVIVKQNQKGPVKQNENEVVKQ
jgi:hypothetical protein